MVGGGALDSQPRPHPPTVEAQRLQLPTLRGRGRPPGLRRGRAGVGVVKPTLHRKRRYEINTFKIKETGSKQEVNSPFRVPGRDR